MAFHAPNATEPVDKDGALEVGIQHVLPASKNETSVGPDWTEQEEKEVIRKLDFIVMPLLMAGFFVLQLDRGNIGNAITDFFFQDVGITQFQFNIGQQLLSAGIVLLEIPSNLLLYRVGPQIWISVQIIAWGLVATFQAFQKGLGAFLATRLLLGLMESGFIPAALYTITRYYKKGETATRFNVFFTGNAFAAATSGLIAYGILHMRGVRGLAGWQWLFIIEGLLTITVGFIFALFFPQSTHNPKPFLKLQYFSERQRHILQQRVLLDDPTKNQERNHITKAELTGALGNWRAYPHIIVTFCTIASTVALGTYTPSIINSYGYPRLQSNALASVAGFLSIIMLAMWGKLADIAKNRGLFVVLAAILTLAFAVTTRQLAVSSNKQLKYGILLITSTFLGLAHPMNASWLALNARSAGERSIHMAMIIMTANASGIAGGQFFQAADRPLYRKGFAVIVGLLSVAAMAGLLANAMYVLLNRRLDKKEAEGAELPVNIVETEEGTIVKAWRYSL